MTLSCTMILGDSFDVLGTLCQKQAYDAMLCDLPFGETKNTWDTEFNLEELWAWWRDKRRDSASAMCFGTLSFLHRLIASNRREFRYELVWSKTRGSNPLVAKYRPVPSHEYVGIFGKGRLYYQSMKELSSKRSRIRTQKSSALLYGVERSSQTLCIRSDNLRHPLSVRSFASDSSSRNGAPDNPNTQYHPTQKPILLLRWLMQSYVPPRGLVIDPSSGSASTAIAALSEGRSAICVERDSVFFERGLERLRRYLQDTKSPASLEIRR